MDQFERAKQLFFEGVDFLHREVYDVAEQKLREANSLVPDRVSVLTNLAAVLLKRKKIEESQRFARKSIELDSKNMEGWLNLGACLQEEQDFVQALACYGKAIEIDSCYAQAWYNCGIVLYKLKRYDEALAHFDKATTLQPTYVDAWLNRGIALMELKRFDESLASYDKAIALKRDYAEIWLNRGFTFAGLKRFDEALADYTEALQLKPDYAEAWNNRGVLFQGVGQHDVALSSFEAALRLKPDDVVAWDNRGTALLSLGRAKEACECFNHALDLDPSDAVAVRSGMTASLYLPGFGLSPSAWHRGPLFAPRELALPYSWTGKPRSHSKIRIGYVSSDFRAHPVAFNLLPIVTHHDVSEFEVYCYSNVREPDAITEQFRQRANQWRSILEMTDAEAASLIRSDGIDVLVLLAGRFDGNRPFIAAHRAAPVQVSLYDAATSGLRDMDYFIADVNLVPKHGKEWFTERVVRVPTFYIHEPLCGMPDVVPTPAKKNAYLTFGSFNNPAKLTEEVVDWWAEVLLSVPNSRLMLKYKAVYGQASVRARYLQLFQARGVSADRLDLVARTESRVEHLARYADIDIVLDPFPFTGATATFESLWMGVPVITLMGEWFMARWSGAMLKKLKLDELIAADRAEYVAIAQRLAGDIAGLDRLRAGLRERVERSPLCDEQAHARHIERAYRWMWRKWCATENIPLSRKRERGVKTLTRYLPSPACGRGGGGEGKCASPRRK